ncbi:MAG: hypothetical protein WCB46_07230 [Methanoregula sp.]
MMPEVIFNLVTTITATLKWDGIIKIATMLGFVNAFLSLAITQSFSRKAFVRWRPYLLLSLSLLWSVVIFVLFDVYLQILIPGWLFYLSTLVVIFWIFGVILLIWTFKNTFTVDQQPFSITGCTGDQSIFKRYQTRFSGTGKNSCIDDEIQRANRNAGSDSASPRYPVYPIILAADETWKPWKIAGSFIENVLEEKNAGVIWFWFARPSDVAGRKIEGGRVVHIDCFDPGKNFANAGRRGVLSGIRDRIGTLRHTFPADNVLYADPRNPAEIDRQYTRAVKHLKDDLGCDKLCALYDPISDFLYFSDVEMASRYLRVTMAWEEQNNIHSLYIMRSGVLDPKLEQYILWYANTVITLKTSEGKPTMEIRGLDKNPVTYAIDYDLNCNQVVTGSPGAPGPG